MSRPVFVEAWGETSQSGVISSLGTWPPGSPPIPFGQSLNFRQRKDILETFMAPQMRLVDLHSWHFYIVHTISQCPQFHNIKMRHCPEPNLCVREKLCPLTTAICFARSTLNIFLYPCRNIEHFLNPWYFRYSQVLTLQWYFAPLVVTAAHILCV